MSDVIGRLNRLLMINATTRMHHGDWLCAMNKSTYDQFAVEMAEQTKATARTATEARAVHRDLILAGEKMGTTGVQFRGAHICIVPWLDGIALHPYSGEITPSTRMFVLGHE